MTTETTLGLVPEENIEQKKVAEKVETEHVTPSVKAVDDAVKPEVVKAETVKKPVEPKATPVASNKGEAPKVETTVEEKAKVAQPVESAEAKASVEKKTETVVKKTVTAKVEKPLHVYDTIVVGAGISGIAAAYQMNKAGYHNYIVLEKASRVGGTWRDNNYPGCGCDVPSAVYSFSFSQSHKWSHLFAKQPEILNYLEEVAAKFDLNKNI